MFWHVLLTLVVLATAEFPEGIKAAIPKGLQVKTVSRRKAWEGG